MATSRPIVRRCLPRLHFGRSRFATGDNFSSLISSHLCLNEREHYPKSHDTACSYAATHRYGSFMEIMSLHLNYSTVDVARIRVQDSGSEIHLHLSAVCQQPTVTLSGTLQAVAYGGNEYIDQVHPGIYFCCNRVYGPDTTRLPRTSPYGSERLIVPVSILDRCRLYFLNQYMCGRNTYVILVAAPPETVPENDLQQKGLIPLDWSTNPFFRRINGRYQYRGSFWVEIYRLGNLSKSGIWTSASGITVTGRNTLTH